MSCYISVIKWLGASAVICVYIDKLPRRHVVLKGCALSDDERLNLREKEKENTPRK